jgi:chloramphenicol 3-O phosphotransferase
MPTGKLIILNGGSSAGKTSLGRALQDLLPDCHMLLGIDTFWLALPPAQLNLSHVSAAYYTWRSETGADGREYFVVEPGPILDQAMYARYRAIKAYLDFGLHVIADDVIWKRDWLVDMVRLFDGYHVTFVGVHVSDAEGARREILRGDRHAGWNRGSARAAHAYAIYDVEIDTTSLPPNMLAQQLVDQLAACPSPTAFATLRASLV